MAPVFAAALGVAVGLAPASGGVHDGFGSLAIAPSLPSVVVVEASGDPGWAADLAAAAGATEVWAVGDVAGTHNGADLLERGPDGAVRTSAGARLPLPEALGTTLRLSDTALAGVSPALLAGRRAVIVPASPTVAELALAPGGAEVPAAELLAVALGVERDGGAVFTLPLPLAAGLVGLVALLGALFASLARRPALVGAATGVGVIAVGVAARVIGIDLPIVGLACAIVVPVAGRVVADVAASLQSSSSLIAAALRRRMPGLGRLPG